jgi:hypothetical protein
MWFRRARLLIVSPDSRANLARRQAETPLIALFRFAEPALSELEGSEFNDGDQSNKGGHRPSDCRRQAAEIYL